MNRTRVKLTFTFTAAGVTAPLFICVTGLTKDEMPNDDMIALKVEGHAIGGAGVSVTNNCIGYVVLMRSEKNTEKKGRVL